MDQNLSDFQQKFIFTVVESDNPKFNVTREKFYQRHLEKKSLLMISGVATQSCPSIHIVALCVSANVPLL